MMGEEVGGTIVVFQLRVVGMNGRAVLLLLGRAVWQAAGSSSFSEAL